ncbi:hypothetical protein DNU06_01570 [Putridiphycobacter roseus]|uniref:Uncharacterized protein n=1 Tax=Putridiphycobacter roseus TaxID=2219161 RepID=A0A2W1NUU9_9FLAO|nr:hypothetical protein [Putridiphycobacter roseus]PZE18548.1 hypothetical protein DNU06_01570 [Putridiphycobacter roseus]
MKKYPFLSLVVVLIAIQCRKDKSLPYCEEFPQNCVEIMTVKDHFYFDVGTYWVYQEETTGQLDSQWVSESYTQPNVCWFNYTINSSITAYYSHITSKLLAGGIDSGLVKKDERTILIARAKTKAGDFVGNSWIAPFYYEMNDSVGNWGGVSSVSYLWVENRYPEFIQFNLHFIDVIKIRETHNIAEQSQATIHFYAKDVGLIRKELLDSNKVWNLIRDNIVK